MSCKALPDLQAAEPLPPSVIKHIAKELKDLQEKPEEGIKVCQHLLVSFSAREQANKQTNHTESLVQLILSDDNIADVQAEYEGPGSFSLCRTKATYVALL